jgi:hypothetical protein
MEAEMAGASAPTTEAAGEPVSASGVPLTESSPAPASTAAPSATSPATEKAAPAVPTTSATAAAAGAAAPQAAEANSPASQSLQHQLSSSSGVPTASGSTTPTSDAAAKRADGSKGKKPAMTAEQKAKLEEMDAAKEKARVERIETLQKKLIDRIRPFVTAKKPGDKHDEETQRFEANVRTQAEDLKLESFGVEVRHSRPESSEPVHHLVADWRNVPLPAAPHDWRVLHPEGDDVP